MFHICLGELQHVLFYLNRNFSCNSEVYDKNAPEAQELKCLCIQARI
jgi:hypothetical protein